MICYTIVFYILLQADSLDIKYSLMLSLPHVVTKSDVTMYERAPKTDICGVFEFGLFLDTYFFKSTLFLTLLTLCIPCVSLLCGHTHDHTMSRHT